MRDSGAGSRQVDSVRYGEETWWVLAAADNPKYCR